MQCKNCGAQLEQEARYCQDCGFPVAGTGATSVRPVDAAKESGRVARSRPLVIIVSLLCIAAIAAIAFAVVGTQGNRSEQAASPSASASSSAQADGESAASEDSEDSEDASEAEDDEAEARDEAGSDEAESDSAESEPPAFDQVAAESQARRDAVAAGMQLFSGTVHMTTYGQRAAEASQRNADDFASVADQQLALLEFSVSETVTASSVVDQGTLQTRANQERIALDNPWEWEDYDGQLVTVAAYAEDLIFPGAVAGALYSARGGVELIAPLTEERASSLTHPHIGTPYALPVEQLTSSTREREDDSKDAASKDGESSSDAASATGGDYVLADSASKAYTKDELSKLSDYELFIARNEIYARHGRQFQSSELQEYFSSKSWYHGTVPSASFDEGVLSDAEQANITLMRQIEESRNSKYL